MQMKTMIYICVFIFGAIGSYIPILLGIDDGFGGWSILGSLVGGLFGIWVGVKIAKRY